MLYDDSEFQQWGEFVEIVYQMYFSDVNNTAPTQPPLPAGWKLLFDITIEPVSTLLYDTTFIGVIAQSESDPSHIAIVFHGTEGYLEWMGDFEVWQTPFTEISNGGYTEAGFTEMYRTLHATAVGTGTKQPLAEIDVLDDADQLTIAGHSLGAALAILHGAYVANLHPDLPLTLYTYAAPMVGDFQFAKRFKKLVPVSYRIYNSPDLVPRVPGTDLGYVQTHGGIEINSRLNPEIKQSYACYHSLLVYLWTLKSTEFGLGGCAINLAEATGQSG